MEKITLYKVKDKLYTGLNLIEKIQAIRVTQNSYWVENDSSARRMITDFEKCFKTKQEAVDFLRNKANQEIESAKSKLFYAEKFLEHINQL